MCPMIVCGLNPEPFAACLAGCTGPVACGPPTIPLPTPEPDC